MASHIPAGVVIIALLMIQLVTAGPEVGSFRSTTHGVSGDVSVQDRRSLKITSFRYDGKASAVFFMGMKRKASADAPYSSQGVAFEYGPSINNKSCDQLGETRKSELLVFIPDAYFTMTDFNMLSVYDYQTCLSLGMVDIPEHLLDDPNILPVKKERMTVTECRTSLPPCSKFKSVAGMEKGSDSSSTGNKGAIQTFKPNPGDSQPSDTKPEESQPEAPQPEEPRAEEQTSRENEHVQIDGRKFRRPKFIGLTKKGRWHPNHGAAAPLQIKRIKK